VRDDENYWQSVEGYISQFTSTRFSHGICPTCYESEVEPFFDDEDEDGVGGDNGRQIAIMDSPTPPAG
jgi:hypothetical protein